MKIKSYTLFNPKTLDYQVVTYATLEDELVTKGFNNYNNKNILSVGKTNQKVNSYLTTFESIIIFSII